MNAHAIVYREHGAPAAVARLEPINVPAPQPHEARVRMLFAPINPADLNVIEGKYAIRPPLPAVAGVEGAGVVEEIGDGVHGLDLGTLVLLPHGVGTWTESCVVSAERLIAVPRDVSPEQAAMLRINPTTALRMLSDFVALRPGEWVIQNAANSAVGRAVIRIAHSRGLRTLNLVRRPELIDELLEFGADAVLLDTEAMREQAESIVDGAEIRLALNAVGGESALRLANALAPGGTVVTYGAMSRQPLRIPNGLLIFKDLRWRGFWVTQWWERANPSERTATVAELFAMTARGELQIPIEKVYALSAVESAITHAQQSGRMGKILFGISPS